MKRPARLFFCAAAALIALAALPGCLTAADGIGALLEGGRGRVRGRYRSPPSVPAGQGVRVLERAGGLDILIEAFPALTLRASAPGEGGVFRLLSLEYLAASPQGWVEFSLELSGEGGFVPKEGGLRLASRPEPLRILGGKIRWKDARLSGEDALRALEGRYERIRALAGWMRRQEAPAFVGQDLRDFRAYWKPRLFPELVPKADRPRSYTGRGPMARAEQARWDTAYTVALLPEELRPLRDSGALKRDWEECGEWIFLEYAWEDVFAALENGGLTVLKN
ncbi:MAG: hypothetical protein LBO76_05090 [Treponema sp.]|jgi:hypothetical protein|nr:hypothetical protein [Treponema sp.]